MKKAVAIILAVLMLFALCACGNSGKTNDSQNMQSLIKYAEQLEKAGNSEAAAAVYELIAQGGGAELIEKAHEEFPAVKDADEIEQVEEVFDHLKGGDGK
ncbi:MAG: hypothetical protein IJJ40_01780 [Clostridia bacterium]|nr:hypothetical protein [Clostridia bacterium]